MRDFTTGELEAMQSTQQVAMQDQAQLLERSSASDDDYGLPVETFTAGTLYDCGLDPSAMDEGMDETEVVMMDAKLRLPLSAQDDLDNVDRIKITKRFGVTLTAQPVYEIVGDPERGPSGLVLNLKLLTDGSS
jgi:hypothetical protein